MLKVKDIKPMFNRILTTAEKYSEDQFYENGLIDTSKTEGSYKEYQKVVRVGSVVREVKPGDLVLIDPTRYIRRKYDENSIRDDFNKNPIVSIEIPTVQMNDEDYFMIEDRDIIYVISDYEEVKDPPKSTIIKPKTPSIIV